MSTSLLRKAFLGTAVLGTTFYAANMLPRVAHADAGDQPRKVFGGLPKRLTLQSTEELNHNTKRLRFALPDQDAVSGLSLTSALLLITWPSSSWAPVPRPYTPVSDLSTPGYIDFVIKQYPGGKASTHLHSMTPGQTVFMAGPLPGVKWTPNASPHVLLIAGGAGITPVYQLLHGILNNEADKTKVTLLWGVNGDEDAFFKDEFAALEKEYAGRFKAVVTVSRPTSGTTLTRGKITKALIEKEMPAGGAKVFVCGPPAMEESVAGKKQWSGRQGGVLQELGVKSEDVHVF